MSLDRGYSFDVAKFTMYCNCNSIIDANGIENMTSLHAVTHHLCLHMLKYQCRLNNRIYQHHGNTFREGFNLRMCLRFNSTLKFNNYNNDKNIKKLF